MRQAPPFSLQDQNGETKSLNDYAGKWIVLYFYPKDDTPGCTTEACNFRDARDSITNITGAEIIGISKDSVRKHANFARKHQLNFTLLSDPDAKVIKAYDAWGKRKLFGHEFEGILRNTYLINPEGKIVKQYESVDPKEHAAEIIHDLQTLQ